MDARSTACCALRRRHGQAGTGGREVLRDAATAIVLLVLYNTSRSRDSVLALVMGQAGKCVFTN